MTKKNKKRVNLSQEGLSTCLGIEGASEISALSKSLTEEISQLKNAVHWTVRTAMCYSDMTDVPMLNSFSVNSVPQKMCSCSQSIPTKFMSLYMNLF